MFELIDFRFVFTYCLYMDFGTIYEYETFIARWMQEKRRKNVLVHTYEWIVIGGSSWIGSNSILDLNN